jgi:hypothetical protein
MAMNEISASNSLADLAARIKVEHEAVSTALKEGVRRAIAAGELLIEAKGQLDHGQWLPWLAGHCSISERTAQLYMRVAKNKAEIEANAQRIADLTLNEAAALLMLSSDVRKLLNFAKQTKGLAGEELIDFCIANGVGVIQSPGYDPFAGRTEAEKLEWLVFTLFLSFDRAARRAGFDPDDARQHVEYLLQRPFQNVDDWLGPGGEQWRRVCGFSRQPSEEFKADWAAFRDAHRHAARADIEAEFEALKASWRREPPRARRSHRHHR